MTNKEAIEKLKEILFMTGYKEAINLAIKALEERPQGEWIHTSECDEEFQYRCSKCNLPMQSNSHFFCPNCGAEMQKESSRVCAECRHLKCHRDRVDGEEDIYCNLKHHSGDPEDPACEYFRESKDT